MLIKKYKYVIMTNGTEIITNAEDIGYNTGYYDQFSGTPHQNISELKRLIVDSFKKEGILENAISRYGVDYRTHEGWMVSDRAYGNAISDIKESQKRRCEEYTGQTILTYFEQTATTPDPLATRLALQYRQQTRVDESRNALTMDMITKILELACHKEPELGTRLVQIFTECTNEIMSRNTNNATIVIEAGA
jgi:hypothetical protein